MEERFVVSILLRVCVRGGVLLYGGSTHLYYGGRGFILYGNCQVYGNVYSGVITNQRAQEECAYSGRGIK